MKQISIRNKGEWLQALKHEGVVSLETAGLSRQQLVDFCKSVGQCSGPGASFNDPEFPEIYRIVKNTKPDVRVGMFADGDLGWHCNGSSRVNNPHYCVALYCVESEVSVATEWCNLAAAFSDLSEQKKNFLRDLEIEVGPRNGEFYKIETGADTDALEMQTLKQQKNIGGWKRLVSKHPFFNLEVCLFHHLFIEQAKQSNGELIDAQALIADFKDHFFHARYRDQHVFQPGDFVLSDQLIGVHRRPNYSGKRLLYRLTFNYESSGEYCEY